MFSTISTEIVTLSIRQLSRISISHYNCQIFPCSQVLTSYNIGYLNHLNHWVFSVVLHLTLCNSHKAKIIYLKNQQTTFIVPGVKRNLSKWLNLRVFIVL